MDTTAIIAGACLASLIVFTIVLVTYAANLKKDFDNKMRNVVDQVNNSNYYQFELEKKSHDKLNSLDNNVNNVRSKYLSRDEAKERINTKTLDANNIYQHDGNMKVDGSMTFNNAIRLDSDSKSLQWKIPASKNISFKDQSGKTLLGINKDVSSPQIQADKLLIGKQHQLLQDNEWIKLFDKDGNNYFGGFAAANVYSRDSLYGNSADFNNVNIKNRLLLKGGVSEHNPNNWQTHFPWEVDGKNYIRGDTQLRGNTNVIGDINANRDLTVNNSLKANEINANKLILGQNWKNEWADKSLLTVYSSNAGASFGNEYFSHFSGPDGNTYIRPGKSAGSIFIGDVGNTLSVQLGDENTTTNIKGNICVGNTCFSKDDMEKVKKNTDINLIELSTRLKDQIANEQNRIDALAREKAAQEIAQYQLQQQSVQKSLQEQIDDINISLKSIQTKLS